MPVHLHSVASSCAHIGVWPAEGSSKHVSLVLCNARRTCITPKITGFAALFVGHEGEQKADGCPEMCSDDVHPEEKRQDCGRVRQLFELLGCYAANDAAVSCSFVLGQQKRCLGWFAHTGWAGAGDGVQQRGRLKLSWHGIGSEAPVQWRR